MNVLIPLPSRDFDPTEAAISWKVLTQAGHTVRFATPTGERSHADDLMITGVGLDPWGFIPGLRELKVMGAILRGNADGRAAYRELEADPDFLRPLRHDALEARDFHGVLLPGGHRARGMREYLESPRLQAFVVDAFARDLVVGAVCHGVLLAARSISPATGRSVLHGRETTSLTWSQEHLAANIGRVARFWDPHYYRTYLEKKGEACGYMGVEQEVTRLLAKPEDYRNVPKDAPDYALKTDGRHRDTMEDARPAFVVEDGRYVSARWPGDVHTFAKAVVRLLG